ncbi:MAG: hypothetical protein ACRETF_07060 [Nevskiaceae bacterium]
MKVRYAMFLVALGCAPAAQAGVEECVAIESDAERLTCYDRVAGRAEPGPATADFGLPRKPLEEPKLIKARLVGPFKGWETGTQFTLDNGQVWRAQSDRAYYPGVPDNPDVTIEKSWTGAYWMRVAGVARNIKVKRIS